VCKSTPLINAFVEQRIHLAKNKEQRFSTPGVPRTGHYGSKPLEQPESDSAHLGDMPEFYSYFREMMRRELFGMTEGKCTDH
jgi:hypothetical protein